MQQVKDRQSLVKQRSTVKPVTRYYCPQLKTVVTVYPVRKYRHALEKPSSRTHARTKYLPRITVR